MGDQSSSEGKEAGKPRIAECRRKIGSDLALRPHWDGSYNISSFHRPVTILFEVSFCALLWVRTCQIVLKPAALDPVVACGAVHGAPVDSVVPLKYTHGCIHRPRVGQLFVPQ